MSVYRLYFEYQEHNAFLTLQNWFELTNVIAKLDLVKHSFTVRMFVLDQVSRKSLNFLLYEFEKVNSVRIQINKFLKISSIDYYEKAKSESIRIKK